MKNRRFVPFEQDKEILKIIVIAQFQHILSNNSNPAKILTALNELFYNQAFLHFNQDYADIYFGYERKIIMQVLESLGRLIPDSKPLLENEDYCDIFIGFPTLGPATIKSQLKTMEDLNAQKWVKNQMKKHDSESDR